jgi:hypothetical protein
MVISGDFERLTGADWNQQFADQEGVALGREWEIRGGFVRIERMKWADVFDDGWRVLFHAMEYLARPRARADVRLVFWGTP